jgi:hypothetical protein
MADALLVLQNKKEFIITLSLVSDIFPAKSRLA